MAEKAAAARRDSNLSVGPVKAHEGKQNGEYKRGVDLFDEGDIFEAEGEQFSGRMRCNQAAARTRWRKRRKVRRRGRRSSDESSVLKISVWLECVSTPTFTRVGDSEKRATTRIRVPKRREKSSQEIKRKLIISSQHSVTGERGFAADASNVEQIVFRSRSKRVHSPPFRRATQLL